MIQRSILVAEDLKSVTPVFGVAQNFSKMLHEDIEVLKASPGEVLRQVHHWPRPEMVILGSHDLKDMEKILLASERPVMVVGPNCKEAVPPIKMKKSWRILVATDLTRDSRPAEHYALSLAARMDADVMLFHSVFEQLKRVQTASLVSGFASFDMERITRKMVRDAENLLQAKKEKMRRAFVNCDYKVSENDLTVTSALLAEAGRGYQFMVMGTHSRRNKLMRALLGSTARDAILRAEIPVVVVHTH